MRSSLIALAVAVLASAALAASASASFLVYQCGASAENLCRVNPDGSGQAQLTNDGQAGTSNAYFAPSLSRDGNTLAFVFGNKVYVGSSSAPSHAGAGFASTALVTRLRPDGGQVAELETALGMEQVCLYNLDGSGRHCPYGTSSANWSADNDHLLISVSAGAPDYNRQICYVAAAANEACSTVKANDASHDLYDPAVSPDGSTLAVTVAPIGGTTGYIALYDYNGGAFIRNLTDPSNSGDETPVWSPDGTRIAFQRGGAIFVTAASGGPGSEHQLVTGLSPTWGGGPDVNANPPQGNSPVSSATCKVPKVVGKKLGTAKRAIKRAHCKVGHVKRKHAKRRLRGRVISEKPKAGRRVAAGTKVALVVGR